MRRAWLVAGLLGLLASQAAAWPTSLMHSLARDARRLVPRSLSQLMAEREPQILEELARFPPPLSRALAADLSAGKLQAETLAALESRTSEAVRLLQQRRVSEGIVLLGSVLRIPADLSDPVLSAGPEGYPAGVVREYYAFVEESLDKMPVVLDDAAALKLGRRELPAYWQGLLGRSRVQSRVIRIELFQRGRVVDHRTLDYRSPVFGVASIAYSRTVTAIAATWLALWREARGDLTRSPTPVEVGPRDDGQSVRSPQTPNLSSEAVAAPPERRATTRLFGRRPPI